MPETRTPRFVQTWVADSVAERAAACAALAAEPARIAPKFFYDRLGSTLFDAITELPEYYPTRTEASIFAAHAAEMARAVGSGMALIDLGAGNCAKAVSLFPLLEPRRYIAVDISVEFLREALRRVQREHPQLDDRRPRARLFLCLDVPADLLDGARPVFFYPGSSIGNFAVGEALAFLRRIRARAEGGGLLIGVDLVKPRAVLEAAYDDALGVTAAFNLNALRHLNASIDADFEPRQWRHVAFFDEARVAHRDASRSARAAGRLVAGRQPPIRRRRAHPHRELVQVHARRIRRAARGSGLRRAAPLDRREGLVRRVLGGPEAPGRRRR